MARFLVLSVTLLHAEAYSTIGYANRQAEVHNFQCKACSLSSIPRSVCGSFLHGIVRLMIAATWQYI